MQKGNRGSANVVEYSLFNPALWEQKGGEICVYKMQKNTAAALE